MIFVSFCTSIKLLCIRKVILFLAYYKMCQIVDLKDSWSANNSSWMLVSKESLSLKSSLPISRGWLKEKSEFYGYAIQPDSQLSEPRGKTCLQWLPLWTCLHDHDYPIWACLWHTWIPLYNTRKCSLSKWSSYSEELFSCFKACALS